MSGRGGPRYGENKHKNVTLRSVTKNGFQGYKLIGPEGDEIEAFNLFSKAIAKLSHNTQKNYCYHIADAYDFLFEGSYHMTLGHSGNRIDLSQLRVLLHAWSEYLINGINSQDEIAALVAKTLPSPMISSNSATVKIAALRQLLRLSEQIRTEQETSVRLGFLKEAVDLNILYPQISQSVQIDRFQRRRMLESSMLAGVIAGGPKQRQATVLPTKIPKTSREMSKVFPLDKVAKLIANCSTYRDKALNSFYAASGCRQHEGLQLLWIDIDIQAREAKLIEPISRPRYQALYAGLTNVERQKLAWKSRTTPDTFLIEPFASMFFEHLEAYVRHEYLPHNEHGFVFQHLTRRFAGRPYFLSTSETRSQAFYRATKGLALPPEINGAHTLRHMYGTYVLNYFPRSDGDYGMPIEDVQRWMGHANIKQTQRYAIKDKELQRAALAWGNAQVYGNGKPKTLTQLKIDALTAQIKLLERQQVLALEDARHA